MKRWKKLFALLLVLIMVLASFNINAKSVLANETTAVLTSVSITNDRPVPSHGGLKAFKLKGSNIKFDDVRAKVALKGSEESSPKIIEELIFVGKPDDKNKSLENLNIKFNFSPNETKEDQIYTVSFSVDGGKTFYDKKGESHESGLSVEPIEVTVKGSSSSQPNTGTEPEKKPEISEIKVSYEFGMAAVSIKGENLSQVKFKAKVTLEDDTKLENFSEPEWTSYQDKSMNKIISLPENNTENDIIYKISISIDGGKSYLEDKAVTVTVPKKVVVADTEVVDIAENGISISEKKFNQKGGDIQLFVKTKENTTSDKIKAKITQIVDGKEVQGYINGQIEAKAGKSKLFKFTANFPENSGKEAKEYKIVFNAKGSETEFHSEPALKVIVVGKDEVSSETEMALKSIKVSVPGLPKTGGSSNITIIGSGLNVERINPVITKTVDGNREKVVLGVEKNGSDKAASFVITFPKAASEKVETYEISIGDKSVTVTVGGRVSGILQEILPSRVYTNKDKTVITVYYDEEIYAVADDYKELKEGITLQAYNYGQMAERKLTDKDDVTIDVNKVIIKLATPFNGGINSKLEIEERLLKDKEGFEARKISQIIDVAKPIVTSSMFTKGEVLTKEGGEVELKLIGEGFMQSVGGVNKSVNTLVKVLENNKEKTELYGVIGNLVNKKNNDAIKVSTNEEGTEQTIGFALPTNDTGKTKTYSVMVSLDGGRTYSSALGVNILENRAKRLVASVLPTAENDGKPSLSFMSITSYGTQGGGKEEADITHTETPNGQESKKTWVTVFGANLDKSLTKIRIIDRNDIIWYPLQNEGTSDSTSNFIMVSSDGTGIFGNGNTQMLEVIGMNNILTTEKFTYQLAVDGKNYNTETVVTVTVPYDGAPVNTKKHMTEEFIRNVKVSHVTSAGKVLEAETEVRGYSWSKLRSFGIKNKDFDNCTILGYRKNGSKELTPITNLYEELVGKLESVEFVYNKAEKEKPSNVVSNPVVVDIINVPIIKTEPISPEVKQEVKEIVKEETSISKEEKSILKDETPLGKNDTLVKQNKNKTKVLSTNKEVFKLTNKILNSLVKDNGLVKIAVKNGGVSLDIRPILNENTNTAYLKISINNNKKDIKKAISGKKYSLIAGNGLYSLNFVLNGKRISKLSSVITVSLKTKKAVSGKINVINLRTGTKIKAKYDKKSKSVVFKTSELGRFVIVK